jgi:hypothetical protein
MYNVLEGFCKSLDGRQPANTYAAGSTAVMARETWTTVSGLVSQAIQEGPPTRRVIRVHVANMQWWANTAR